MKKVLIITYYWPPSGGPGVQRTLKFARYLPQFGVIPDIITVDINKASYPVTDRSLLDEVPENIRVYRTDTSEPFGLYSKMSQKKEIPYSGFANESNPGFLQKVARFIRGNFFIPDARKGWNKFVIKQADELFKTNEYAAIIVSSPPHSTQLAALELKKKYGIKWIADMRDPWTDIYYYKEMMHTSCARKKDLKFEKSVLENADEIVVVSEAIKKLFLQKSDKIQSDKIHVIPNGYDEPDFAKAIETDNEKFYITYTGTLADNYNINSFFQALKLFIESNPDFPLFLRFVGKVSPGIKQQIKDKQLVERTEFIDHVSHAESINYMMKSSVLLMAIPDMADNKGILTGKLFEYLASKKPIINIGPVEGDAAGIIRNCEAGNTYSYHDINGILDQLKLYAADYSNEKNLSRNNNLHQCYSRTSLTKMLVDIIDKKAVI